ncbi:globin [Gynuella sp.]|uniref:globin n=1 Tax=Gynuella sp. TaxID=2969146 RepID=UPI003D0E670B
MGSHADAVFQSYGRSCNKPVFFEDFYTIFTGKSHEIRDMFRNTDMQAQKSLLRTGILVLVMNARGMPDTKVNALGKSHSKKGLNVHPRHYALWLDALMETLSRHDPEFNPALEVAWRSTLQPIIDKIAGMYEQ